MHIRESAVIKAAAGALAVLSTAAAFLVIGVTPLVAQESRAEEIGFERLPDRPRR